ncbi:MAG: Glutamate--tRNA ligase [Lentisphaerae bacterium ADurb.BinA184]|nr:MAG: Glutamate--tRNA ligase [Lentisphaerae bacterium ADurb.BinA184]
MSVRVRFAPSPTGHVHIGNIRAAIFNWLFARHENGVFLLRVEDTDRERSTPAAIASLLDVMQWLGLDYDEAPLYQTSQVAAHLEAARRLLEQGDAYTSAKGGDGEAIVFRIPWEAERVPGVALVGPVETPVHPETPVTIDRAGVAYALVSAKGKAVPAGGCLAGFRDLEVLDADGRVRFRLADVVDQVLAGAASFAVEQPARLRYTRRQVGYHDAVKGDLAKPLDSLRDFVIVRSDRTPVFHLANVCDDITQHITHIIRGDDHVENTYRHVFLFAALGAPIPHYAHLPMIVNREGKPYSKRDGDAFVGDFRDKGYLPEALFNYLTLLGWSPGDDREKLSRRELVSLFTLDRVQSSPAQMDARKLDNLNGQYMAALPAARFAAEARARLRGLRWADGLDEALFGRVAALMQSRAKRYADVEGWAYFFGELPEYEAAACAKFLAAAPVRAALGALADRLDAMPELTDAGVEAAVREVAAAHGFAEGKLNQPIRVATTGCTIGAGIYETLVILGRSRSVKRLRHAVAATSAG